MTGYDANFWFMAIAFVMSFGTTLRLWSMLDRKHAELMRAIQRNVELQAFIDTHPQPPINRKKLQ